MKLENKITDTNSNGHTILNTLQGTSNNNRDVDQRHHTISKPTNEIHLIQVNSQPLQLLDAIFNKRGRDVMSVDSVSRH